MRRSAVAAAGDGGAVIQVANRIPAATRDAGLTRRTAEGKLAVTNASPKAIDNPRFAVARGGDVLAIGNAVREPYKTDGTSIARCSRVFCVTRAQTRSVIELDDG